MIRAFFLIKDSKKVLWPSCGFRCDNTRSPFVNTVSTGSFQASISINIQKKLTLKGHCSLIGEKTHIKMEAAFLEQPLCAYESCILLKSSHV